MLFDYLLRTLAAEWGIDQIQALNGHLKFTINTDTEIHFQLSENENHLLQTSVIGEYGELPENVIALLLQANDPNVNLNGYTIGGDTHSGVYALTCRLPLHDLTTQRFNHAISELFESLEAWREWFEQTSATHTADAFPPRHQPAQNGALPATAINALDDAKALLASHKIAVHQVDEDVFAFSLGGETLCIAPSPHGLAITAPLADDETGADPRDAQNSLLLSNFLLCGLHSAAFFMRGGAPFVAAYCSPGDNFVEKFKQTCCGVVHDVGALKKKQDAAASTADMQLSSLRV